MATEVDPDSWQGHRMQGGVPPPWLSSLGATLSSLAQRSLPAEPGVDKDQSSIPQTPPMEAPSPLTQVASQQPQEPPQEQSGLPLPTRGIPTTTFSPTGMTAMAGSAPTVSPQLERPQPIPPSMLDRDPSQTPQPSQAFVPNRQRGSELWGQRHGPIDAYPNNPNLGDTPFMPSAQEAPGVISGSAGQLATWGPPVVQGLAGVAKGIANTIGYAMDFYSHGAFGKAYDQATAKRVALRREEMEMERDRLMDVGGAAVRASREHLRKYSEVFDEYRSHALSEDDARQLVHEMAARENDTALQAAVNNGGLAGAEFLLKSRDAKTLDMWSGLTALEQTKGRSGKTLKEESAIDKAIGGGEGGADDGVIRQLPGGGGGEKRAAAAGGDDAKETSDADADIMKKTGVNKQGMEWAHEWLETGKPAGETPNAFLAAAKNNGWKVSAAKNALQDRIKEAAGSSTPPEEKLEAIRKISPTAANAAEGLLNYSADPKKKENASFTQLAHMISPGPNGYDEKRYVGAQEFYKQGGRPQLILSRADLLATAYTRALEAVNALPEGKYLTTNMIEQLKANKFTGDPRYVNAYNALRLFATEAAALAAQGVPRVTMINDFLAHAATTQSPAQLRSLLKTDIVGAGSAIDHVVHGWRDTTKLDTNPPSYNPDNHKIIKYGALINSDTGQVPKGAPDELRAISKKPDPKDKPSWRKPEQEQPPPATLEDAQALTWAKAHPEDPRAAGMIEEVNKRARW